MPRPSFRLEGTTEAVCRFRADAFKALGHPARLFMMQTLAEGEHCVCELQEMVGLDVSTVSKHLSVLRNAGLVVDRREGTKVFYGLCCAEARTLLELTEAPLDGLARRKAREAAASCGVDLDPSGP
jgi:ArsR family transcriptional regulator